MFWSVVEGIGWFAFYCVVVLSPFIAYGVWDDLRWARRGRRGWHNEPHG